MDADTKEKIVGTLTALRALLGDESRWTQGTNARDHEGDPVVWDNPNACKFCLNGGLIKVSGHKRGQDYPAHFNLAERKLEKCADDLYGTGFVAANDSHPHSAVMDVIDCALKHAQAEAVEE
jgi:hypothetical protein